MKKKLLLVFVACLFAVCIRAEETDAVWCAVTNYETYVPLSEIDYMLFPDDKASFAIVRKDGRVLEDVAQITFGKYMISSEPVLNGEKTQVSLYPNPVVRQLTLQGLKTDTKVRIVSSAGDVVRETVAEGTTMTLDVSSLPSGIYLLQTESSTLKFIKQ